MDGFAVVVISPGSPAPGSPLSPSSIYMEVELPSLAPFPAAVWQELRAKPPPSTLGCLIRHGISPHMRARMVDWMIDVMLKLDCFPNSIFLAIKIMDIYFSLSCTPQSQDDLLPTGLVCMFLASKYLDRHPIRLQNLHHRIGFGRIPIECIRAKEQSVLETVGLDLSFPTALDALELLISELGVGGVVAKTCEMILLLVQLDANLAAIDPVKQATCAVFLTFMTYGKRALPCVLQLTSFEQREIEGEVGAMYGFLMDFPKQGKMYQSAMGNLGFEMGEDERHPLFRFDDVEMEAEHQRLIESN